MCVCVQFHYVCMSICLSVCLSVCVYVYLSVCHVCMSVYLSVRLYVRMSITSVCMSVSMSVCLSVCLYGICIKGSICISTYPCYLYASRQVLPSWSSSKRTSVWCLLWCCLQLRFCSRSHGRRVHNHGKIGVEQLSLRKKWQTMANVQNAQTSNVDEFRASFATCLRGSTARAEHVGNRMPPKAQRQMAVQTSPKGKFGTRSASTAYRKDGSFGHECLHRFLLFATYS